MTTERRVPVADGVTLRVLAWGPPARADAAPVLCVHGLASNALTWVAVADRLHDRGHPVAAVDLRGHGRSDKPDDGYDFATMGADLVAVLDALGWSTAVLVGQSTGGNLVVDLATRAPERVAGVVGVDGGALDLQRRWPEWDDCATALAPPRLEGSSEVTMSEYFRRAHPDWSDDGVAWSMANFEVQPDGTVRPWLTFDRHMRLLRALWEHRPSAHLGRIAAPVLLVMADTGDSWAEVKRADAETAVAASPPVEVRWFSPADHDVHVQHPAAVADLVADRFGR